MKSKLEENRKYAALWVNFYVEEDNDIIGWYDHDYEETYSVDSDVDIQIIVSKMLVSENAKVQIKKSLNKLGITSIEQIFMLKRHRYLEEPKIISLTEEQLKKMNFETENLITAFVGNFKYKD